MSLSQAIFFFFSFIFQVISRCVYEAFLTNHERPIDWTATVLQRYVDERRSKDGQHIDFKVDAHRKNFIRKANRYAILNVNGTNFLAKLEKCEDTSTEDNPVYVKKRAIFGRRVRNSPERSPWRKEPSRVHKMLLWGAYIFLVIFYFDSIATVVTLGIEKKFSLHILDAANVRQSWLQYFASLYQEVQVVSDTQGKRGYSFDSLIDNEKGFSWRNIKRFSETSIIILR